LFSGVVAVSAKASSGASSQSITHLSLVGASRLNPTSSSSSSAPTNGTSSEVGQSPPVLIAHSGLQATRQPAVNVPSSPGNPLATSSPGFFGFNGLSHLDQRLAGTGPYTNTQFSLEPPDQGLCVGNGFVLETVNTALVVYDSSGNRLTGVAAINQFLGLSPEIIRSVPPVFGDFASDPRCYFDSGTNRFFFSVVEIDRNSSTGALGPRAHQFIAVTQSGDPTGTWNIFVLDVTDDGLDGTPSHPNCPCFGDQPLIGADANGFYVSTNEFPLADLNSGANFFNGAQIYAMSKSDLAAGVLPTVVQFNLGTIPTPDVGGIWFSVQPATSPPGGAFVTNTELFMSILDFSGTFDNRLAVWGLTGTNTLSSAAPTLTLSVSVIASEAYGVPPNAQQKPGPIPLGTVIIPQLLGGKTEKLELLSTGDDRMQQVVYANGMLWAGLTTAIKTHNGPVRAGIAFFIVTPSFSGGALTAAMTNQGYVAVNQEYLIYPSIGVNTLGQGIMTFTLVGPDFFPSAAYAPVDAVNGVGAVHIAGPGALPEDGFTGYHFFGSPDRSARWGDYSAAVAASDGSIWVAAEYIPNAPRTLLANWRTFVSHVTP